MKQKQPRFTIEHTPDGVLFLDNNTGAVVTRTKDGERFFKFTFSATRCSDFDIFLDLAADFADFVRENADR